ncbi:TPA: hypothetical protein ACXJFW_006262 [Pseudomonas aeruginosa]|uniref:hypothetical protein n=1 Tax=Pseudomonas aeruginosa TaxID=287 RepID=UPI001F41CB73|nr:hypothetical protein [Pseudomonas aeruginosa]MCG0211518.1 hypothetical protein [Pseudomonas aeruginosa]MCG0236349.1 hypothetical protein [Pseudomonas aeruginosa]MCG0364823.1 hypothetical protein [Pseudomonas aeruginosa]MCG0375306.1 hypothetical protein [Pseudomonas aeruginosa]MCG0396524.1 hypothetical protein [Pseudomonas aeruginosa]
MEFTEEDYKEIIHQSRSPYIREMVEILGLERTLQFVRIFEGKTFVVPRFTNRKISSKTRQFLTNKFGEEFTSDLLFHFSECAIHVLSLSTATYRAGIQKRNREIADKAEALIRDGVSIRKIIFDFSQEYGLCDRQILNILSSL